MRKTFFYNFFPSKDEEEACQVNNIPWVVRRELIEIRDIYPAPIINLKNPWQIKKTITQDDLVRGGLTFPFLEAFEYIIRYWKLPDGKSLVNGIWWNAVLWDVTEEKNPKKYDGASVRKFKFVKTWDNDYFLQCLPLFNDRALSVGDEVGLYWDPTSSTFIFKVLSKVRDQRIRGCHQRSILK